jgi:SNF2 family DNA or RNA helicase
MIFDYIPIRRKLQIEEESGEDILRIKDKTNFILCERIRDGKYEVPFITLPIIVACAKKLGYRLTFSKELKSFYEAYKSKRKILEDIKNLDENHFDEKLKDIGICDGFYLTNAQAITIKFAIEAECCCIGNEIGSGKSLVINSIARILLSENKVNKVLLATKASLVDNLHADYIKFFGNHNVTKIGNLPKNKREHLYEYFMKSDSRIMIINYEKFLFDIKYLKNLQFEMVACDEFHKIRNFLNAKSSIHFFDLIKQWKPQYRYCVSGSLIENKLFDIFPAVKFLDNGFIVGGQMFFDNFIEYQDIFFKMKLRNGQIVTRNEKKAVGFRNHEFLKNLIRPYIIRKKGKLPIEKIENFILLEPTESFKDKYNEIRKSESIVSKRYHSLRQFLNDPQREGFKENPKLEKFEEILDQISGKIIVFSFYKCTLKMLDKYLSDKNIGHICFSGDDEQTPFEVIERLRNDDSIKVLVCTDRLAEGHNIQFVDRLINFELALKPSTHQQRIGRIFRMGQTQNITIWTFIFKETIEEVIYENFEKKKHLIDTIIEKLDEKTLKNIEKEIEVSVIKSLMKD